MISFINYVKFYLILYCLEDIKHIFFHVSLVCKGRKKFINSMQLVGKKNFGNTCSKFGLQM